MTTINKATLKKLQNEIKAIGNDVKTVCTTRKALATNKTEQAKAAKDQRVQLDTLAATSKLIEDLLKVVAGAKPTPTLLKSGLLKFDIAASVKKAPAKKVPAKKKSVKKAQANSAASTAPVDVSSTALDKKVTAKAKSKSKTKASVENAKAAAKAKASK